MKKLITALGTYLFFAFANVHGQTFGITAVGGLDFVSVGGLGGDFLAGTKFYGAELSYGLNNPYGKQYLFRTGASFHRYGHNVGGGKWVDITYLEIPLTLAIGKPLAQRAREIQFSSSLGMTLNAPVSRRVTKGGKAVEGAKELGRWLLGSRVDYYLVYFLTDRLSLAVNAGVHFRWTKVEIGDGEKGRYLGWEAALKLSHYFGE
jgi:hypothetical protein